MPRKGAIVDSCHPLDVLLDEEREADQSSTDIVFLTYNFDPAFFESRLLGLCQATGAVTTVVADARIWNPDPRALIAAGQTYHLGLAAVPGAFHPKLMVITSPNRATLTIGSGNVTPGGWQYNTELSTVARARNGECPAIVQAVAEWMAKLPEQAHMDDQSRLTLTRVSEQLAEIARRSLVIDTGHAFAHNLDSPIIEQLPSRPVRALRLHAPFHDPGGQAIIELTRRMKPDTLDIAVQPGYTIMDSRSLGKALTHAPGKSALYVDADNPADGGRYRHGKLIEWHTQDSIHALTGSPNLSVAALLRTIANGNCEIGVIAPVSSTLFPKGIITNVTSVPTTRIPARNKPTTASNSPVPSILGATISTGLLTIEFSAEAPSGLTIEFSSRDQSPDTWTDLIDAPEGASRVETATDIGAGSRIRFRWTSPDGSPASGPAVPVADPERTQRRWATANGQAGQRLPRGSLHVLDMPSLHYLHRELLELARQLSGSRPPRSREPGSSDGSTQASGSLSDSDIEPWLWNEEAESRMAEHLRVFALGLPAITGVQNVRTPAWADSTDISEVAADDDEDLQEELIAELEHSQAAPSRAVSQRNDDIELRERRRKWCWKFEAVQDRLPLPAQLAGLRVALGLFCAGNWDPSDEEDALELIYNLLIGLDINEGTESQRKSAASLAAVALAVLRDRISFKAHTEWTVAFDQLAESLADIFDLVDESKIDQYAQHLTNRNYTPLDPDWVRESTRAVTAGDPLAHLLAGARDRHWRVTRHGSSGITIEGSFAQPTGVLLQALTMVNNDYPVAILVATSTNWAAAAWKPPDLFMIEPGRAGQRWRHWQLDGLMGPSAFAAQMGLMNAPVSPPVDHGPQLSPIPEARQALRDCGIREV